VKLSVTVVGRAPSLCYASVIEVTIRTPSSRATIWGREPFEVILRHGDSFDFIGEMTH